MADQALQERMKAWVGRTGDAQVARDPVNEPTIRRWVDAFEDDNPCYVDADFAARSIHGHLVAPPAMLDVWDKQGQRSRRHPGNPQANVLTMLEEAGFTSTVAVNSELELVRYVRPGETLRSVQTLEAVSDEKETALGTGHFVTTRYRYTTTADEHVGNVVFRVLKFKPGTARPAPPDATGADGPDPDPARRPRPGINRDNQFFWDGARRHELRIQSCRSCGERYFPPTPRCWRCGGYDMGYVVASGRGRLYSWAVPHHPQAAGFRYPVLVGLVELEEGTRLVAEIVACRRSLLTIGMPLEVCWLDSHPALVEGAVDSRGPITIPQFRPARALRRRDTATAGEVAEGDHLPVGVVPITPTLVVSCAFATLDYFDGHHDRDMAVARGSKDIFINIHTSLGLCQRWISDWSGPEAVFRDIRVRLGVPCYPGDTLTLAGRVAAVDAVEGRVSVGFSAFNRLGDHMTGTAELVLPGGPAAGRRSR
jgi:uncharacterized OB-fold protein